MQWDNRLQFIKQFLPQVTPFNYTSNEIETIQSYYNQQEANLSVKSTPRNFKQRVSACSGTLAIGEPSATAK